MKVRRLVTDNQTAKKERRVVWFGSYGTTTKLDANGDVITHPEVQPDGSIVQVPTMFAKFYNSNDKHDNFASGNTWVKDSLVQRLSVIKHELWYNYQYGMPLVDDGTARVTIDAFVMETIQNHEDVLEITSFSSRIEGHEYHCDVGFTTTFGDDTISL